MYELVKAGGMLMVPIILCSIIAMAIVIERFWSLKRERIIPPELVRDIVASAQKNELNSERLNAVREGSPLGRVLVAGLKNSSQSREVMKESIQDTGRHVTHELQRFLNTLGTIAAVSPLLGLLGTVLGMIQVFGVITDIGVGNPGELAGGISKALITTAAGIAVAIPSLMFYRYFNGKVDALVVEMEQESIKLVELVHGKNKNVVRQNRAVGDA